MSDELLTVTEAAKKLGVSARTVQRYCKQGLLNHKWVHGTRHRELRIVPPIPLSMLPGVKHGTAPGAEELVSRREFQEMREMFTREIQSRDHRIEALEKELAAPDRREGSNSANRSAESTESRRIDRLEAVLAEFERVRPVEKKLILKLAQTVREQGEFLRTLGAGQQSTPPEE